MPMAAPLLVKMLITPTGARVQASTNSSDTPSEKLSASPCARRMLATSRRPQYWAARMPVPLHTPKTIMLKMKNRPMAAMVDSPSWPIIRVSAKLSSVFKNCWSTMGSPMAPRCFKKSRSGYSRPGWFWFFMAVLFLSSVSSHHYKGNSRRNQSGRICARIYRVLGMITPGYCLPLPYLCEAATIGQLFCIVRHHCNHIDGNE